MTLIGELLAGWARLVVRFAWLVIAAALVLAVFGLRFLGSHLGVNTDTANMISSELEWRQHFNDYRASFPARDRNLIVVVEAVDPPAAERFARALADRILAEPDVFESVFLGGYGDFFERNGLLYLPVAELEMLSDRLADAQPLLGLIKRKPSGAGVVEVVTRTIAEQGSLPVPGALDELHDAVAAAFDAAARGASAPIDWRALIRADSGAIANPQLLIVQPQLDFTRMRPARPAIDRLRALEAEVAGEIARPVTMRLTGTLAMEDEELGSVISSAGLAGALALVMVAIVLVWSLRSVRLLLVALLTLGVGLIGTATFAAAAVGHLNLLSVAFAVLYVGLGVDFILHVTLRVKELLARGAAMKDAIDKAMQGVGTSLVICTVTTAAGFYAFIPTPFDGVSELGLISGTGMFVSLFASVTLLPALLAAICSPTSMGPLVACPGIVARLAHLNPRWVVGTTGALVVAGAISLPHVYFDSNPVNLRDPDTESVRALEALAARSDADLVTLVAVADDAGRANDWAAQLAALPEVARVADAGSLVPDDQLEKLDVIADIELILGPGIGDLTPQASSSAELRAALTELRATLTARAQRSAAQSRLLAALERLLAGLTDRVDGADGADGTIRRLDRDLLADLPASLHELATALSARSFARDDLPRELAARWIDGRGRELIEIVPSDDIGANDAAARFVTAVRAIVPSATGLPVVYHEAARTVVTSFRLAMSYAFVAVALLLLLCLRSLKDTGLVLVPISAAAIVTAGFTAWFGIPFNFANIIALPLLVGVGVDNAIHMVHRARTEPPRRGDLLNTSTSLAVLASGLTTIASFGNLAFSTHLGMATMGTLLTIGMVTTMLATLVFLPAMLGLRARS